MYPTKMAILASLDPADPATIQALIDFHRTAFGGWTMEVEPDPNPDPTEPDPADPKPDDDKPLGPNGEKALKAERDARKAIEDQFNEFKAGLAAALGIDGKDAKSTTDEVLAGVQQQLATMQRDNLVLSVANTHQITDEDDLGLLRGYQGDEEGLRKLAARLKPTKDENPGSKPGQRRAPGPDHSQGRGSGNDPKPGDRGRAEAARRFQTKKQ